MFKKIVRRYVECVSNKLAISSNYNRDITKLAISSLLLRENENKISMRGLTKCDRIKVQEKQQDILYRLIDVGIILIVNIYTALFVIWCFLFLV